MSETTTDRLAEIEGQPQPQPVQVREGRWRTRNGEIRHVTRTPDDLSDEGRYLWHDAEHCQTWYDNGRYFHEKEHPLDLVEYLGPIQQQPEQTITPDDVAAEAINEWPSVKLLRQEMEATEAALLEQQQRNEQLVTQGSQQRMQIAELQAQVNFLKGRELTLGTRLEEEKAVTTKRLQQVEELRSEVSHVQRLWGESRRRVEELERELSESVTLVVQQQNRIQDLLTMNNATEAEPQPQPQPVHLQAMIDAQAETIARLNSEIHDLNCEIGGLQCKRTLDAELQTQLEAVKAELVQQAETARRLQIELDAREQVPQAVSDRFEEGWDAGNARAVETIAEWTEPFRTCGSQALALAVLQNLPHIMRTLTGLTDED